MFYIYLFDIKLPEDDMQNVEAYRSITELYEKVYFNNSVFVGVIELFINAQI